jgi:toxin ParE1/3/4
MARFRLSRRAQIDLAQILGTSADRWGIEAKRRYAALLTAAMQKVAADPQGSNTRSRADLGSDLRSIHIRHARGDDREAKVGTPVHVVYYRPVGADVIEIVRVLHEHMEPSRHFGEADDPE